jgi:hypothetical protein
VPAESCARAETFHRAPQVRSYTVLTVDSSKPLSWLHDRMPALLTSDEAAAAWLGAGQAGGGGKGGGGDAAPMQVVWGVGPELWGMHPGC